MESHVVAGECAPVDRQRRAGGLHLRRLCRVEVSHGPEQGGTRPLRLDGVRRELHRRIRDVAAAVRRVASLEEAREMGGTHDPMLGVLGVMSAKMTVVNVMILVTFMSFVMYWRAGKQETATWAKAAKVGQGLILGIATVVILVLGVWGYFVP